MSDFLHIVHLPFLFTAQTKAPISPAPRLKTINLAPNNKVSADCELFLISFNCETQKFARAAVKFAIISDPVLTQGNLTFDVLLAA